MATETTAEKGSTPAPHLRRKFSQKTFRLREDYEKTIRYGTTFWIRLNNPNPNPVMDRQ